MRKAVDEQLWKTGGVVLSIYSRAKARGCGSKKGRSSFADSMLAGVGECGGVSDHPQEDDWVAI